MPNHLINETSIYLLQHANNPVDWYPWGAVALDKAKQEQKPILVSIGYAACHWCHVMEHESFEDTATAQIMNSHFINIKIDREERPDLDHIYMDALQALTGQGGWPLNIFLTPELKPFYGGTYFPPKKAYNRNSWSDVLLAIHQAWNERRNEIEAQAEELTAHLIKANSFGSITSEDALATSDNLYLINKNLLQNADEIDGGFGKAPKFPQFPSIIYLLRHYHFFKNEKSLEHAILSINKMLDGGIYDQLGGGMARYSTDNDWLVPHFEKMLYDNALLITTLSEAYSLTKNLRYKNTIAETISFLENTMLNKNGLYYAAMDADSEGIEGKYYCWTYDEIKQVLNPQELEFFVLFFGVKKEGNWVEPHHNIATNILHQTISVKELAKQGNTKEEVVYNVLETAKTKLLKARANRVLPTIDDKCILGWNALLNKAFTKAYCATRDKHYLQLAIQNMDAIIVHFIHQHEDDSIEKVLHTHKNNQSTIPAFLDDIAFTLDALLELENITYNSKYQDLINALIKHLYKEFEDKESPYFFYTTQHQNDIIVRKKEVMDSATPSGNSTLANVLWNAAILFNKPEWGQRATEMLQNLSNAVLKHPGSFAIWCLFAQKLFLGVNEIKINSSNADFVSAKQLEKYVPYKLIINDPHLKNDQFMLCKHNTCHKICYSMEDILLQIKELEADLVEKG